MMSTRWARDEAEMALLNLRDVADHHGDAAASRLASALLHQLSSHGRAASAPIVLSSTAAPAVTAEQPARWSTASHVRVVGRVARLPLSIVVGSAAP